MGGGQGSTIISRTHSRTLEFTPRGVPILDTSYLRVSKKHILNTYAFPTLYGLPAGNTYAFPKVNAVQHGNTRVFPSDFVVLGWKHMRVSNLSRKHIL